MEMSAIREGKVANGKWLNFFRFFLWTFPWVEHQLQYLSWAKPPLHAHCTLIQIIQNIWVELTANPPLAYYPNYPKYLNWPKSPPCMLIGRAVSCRNSCKSGRRRGLRCESVVKGWNCNFVSCRDELFREYQRLQDFTAENVRWTKFRIKPFKGGVR